MSPFPIVTALSLPAVSTFPAANCLQWTGDGQLVLLSRNAIYILTPDPGIAVEQTSVIKQTLDKSLTLGSQNPIGWLRTMIEREKGADIHQWARDTQEWGALSLGSADLAFNAITCSPSNISSNAGCIYAVLDSNAEVSIYHPSKNPLTGLWQKVGDLHSVLEQAAQEWGADLEKKKQKLFRTLHMQTSCIAWSSQADFGLSPVPDADGSLLAVGNRAGCVNLLRYTHAPDSEAMMRPVGKITAGDRWVTRAAWSAAMCTKPGTSQAHLACALADGAVAVVSVVQTLVPQPASPTFLQNDDISVSLEQMEEPVFDADGRNITSLRWIKTSQSEPILVFTKPGVLYLWSKPSVFTSWSGLRRFILKTQKLSVGSTSLSQVSGIAYAQKRDTVVVSLADGSFHTVRNFSTEPTLVSDGADDLSSEAVSKTARSVFIKVEEDDMTRLDVNTIQGMVSYDDDAFCTWIHEAVRPTDFSYKHDAKHTSMIMTAQLWSGQSDDELLEDIRARVLRCNASSGDSPLAILRPIFLSLRDPDRLNKLHTRVLELLRSAQTPDDSADIALAAWTGDLTADFRAQFRRSLRTHLFGRNSFLSLRLRATLSAFCQKESGDPAVQAAFLAVADHAVATLWSRVLRIIVAHLSAVLRLLSPDDVPFVLRIIVQSMLPGTPADLQAEAQTLSTQIQAAIHSPTDVSMSSLGLDELCPACHAVVPLQDVTTATCPNGHVWPRCSVTSFVLATPMVRTCTSCSRKAFLPPPHDAPAPLWLPASARSWVVHELLHAARRCFFCGGSFVTLV